LSQGESGTGKDLVAQEIHLISPRRKQPFIVVNCSAIPEALLEAELFGYTKGSFTGAVQSRIGRIHAAHGGTLFLDEIGDMPLSLQSKMLRFLEQGEVQRLGGNDNLKVDVRVVAATNADLKKLIVRTEVSRRPLLSNRGFPHPPAPLAGKDGRFGRPGVAFTAKFQPGVALSRGSPGHHGAAYGGRETCVSYATPSNGPPFSSERDRNQARPHFSLVCCPISGQNVSSLALVVQLE
jgi:hypothetical protein